MSDLPAPDDNSVTARLTRMEQRLTELEHWREMMEGQPIRRLALPAPEVRINGASKG